MKRTGRLIHSLEGEMVVDHGTAVTQYAAGRYVLGELSRAEREEFEEHYFSCLECAEDVRSLMTISNAKTALAEIPVSAGLTAARRSPLTDWLQAFLAWRPQAAYAMAPAFALLVLAGITTWQSVTLRRQLAPQAVAEFALRPESRGAETVIEARKVGPFFVLAADAPQADRQLKWQIREGESQAALMEGTAASPDPGVPLTLLVPASKFKPGLYILFLRSDKPNSLPAETPYRFRMH